MDDATPINIDASTLSAHRIPSLPPDFYYIPNFLSEDEEARLLEKITSQPPNRWTHLTHRRLLVYPSPLSSSNILLQPPTPLPPWLTTPPLPRLHDLGIFSNTPHAQPNHCLINEYKPGQGIMPHEDGAAYADVVATVSLGGWGVLDIYDKERGEHDEQSENDEHEERDKADGAARGKKKQKKPHYRILQEPRSLLVTTGTAYKNYLHGIAEVVRDENLHGGDRGLANWDLLGDQGRFGWAEGRAEGRAEGGLSAEDGRLSEEEARFKGEEGKFNGEKEQDAVHERGTRISCTWRDVLKVSRVGERLFGGRR